MVRFSFVPLAHNVHSSHRLFRARRLFQRTRETVVCAVDKCHLTWADPWAAFGDGLAVLPAMPDTSRYFRRLLHCQSNGYAQVTRNSTISETFDVYPFQCPVSPLMSKEKSSAIDEEFDHHARSAPPKRDDHPPLPALLRIEHQSRREALATLALLP